MSYSRIDEEGGLQWPCPRPDHPGTQFLFKGGFPRGKARFTNVTFRPSVEQPDGEFPFVLTTGRMLFQYHTGSMTRRVKAIEKVAGTPYIEISREDGVWRVGAPCVYHPWSQGLVTIITIAVDVHLDHMNATTKSLRDGAIAPC